MECSELDNNIPENLLCIICFEVPSNEVFQCANGHIHCGKCYPLLSKCPQCDVPFGRDAIRNIFLEGILSRMKVECPFTQHGCTIKLFEDSLQSHVESCIYNKSKFGPLISICKLIGHPHCPFSINHGNTSEALAHFQNVHNCVIRDSDNFIIEFTNFVEMTHPNGESKMWNPLILNMRLYGFAVMILTIFSNKEKSISWLPLFMPYIGCDPSSIQVKFCIYGSKQETGNGFSTSHLKWSITPIDILNASTFLPNHYPHRIPTPPLVQKYTTPAGSLFIQAKVVRNDAKAGSLAVPYSADNLIVFTPLDVATFENAHISPPTTPSAPPL